MGKDKLLISIIIPLYNTEKYIGECLESIIDPEVPSCTYEIIVIDDGSTDKSGEIVQAFIEHQKNIRLFRQENQGVSRARMNGIRQAEGEYIWFIDSDDLLSQGALPRIIRSIEEESVDVFIHPLLLLYEDGRQKIHNEEQCTQGGTMPGKIFLQRHPVSICPPQFVFRKELCLNPYLFFPEGVRHEDEYFCRVLQYIAPKVSVSDIPLYIYRQWEGSYMNSAGIQSLYDMVDVYKGLDRFRNDIVSEEDNDWFKKDILNFLMGTFAWYPEIYHTKEFQSFRKEHGPYIFREFSHHLRLFSRKERFLGLLLLQTPSVHRFLLKAKSTIKKY